MKYIVVVLTILLLLASNSGYTEDQSDRIMTPPKEIVVSSKGNSPVESVPKEYYPDGSAGWFVIPQGIDAGKRLFFFDHIAGEGPLTATLLFVHGNPECSYTYRKVIKETMQRSSGKIRIVALDHIGFGLSDQASFEMVDMHHTANLLQLIQYLDLNNIVLIVHDWGGAIGIGALLREPHRAKGLIVLNSTVFPIPTDGLTYENYPFPLLSWAKTPDWVLDSMWKNFSSYAILAEPSSSSILTVSKALWYMVRTRVGWYPKHEREARKVFRAQFKSKINSRSSKRMVRQTPVWGHGYVYEDPTTGTQDNREFYQFIQENITHHWGPEGMNIEVKALFGAWDPLAKKEVLEQWENALPQLKGNVQRFEGISHFVEEHKPVEIAEAILAIAN